MRRQQITFLAGITLLLLLAETLCAQVYRGVVLDEATRKPVPFETASLQNDENEHVRHTSTDENGTFLLTAPRVTDYYLYAKRIGYSGNTDSFFWLKAKIHSPSSFEFWKQPRHLVR